MKKIDRYIFRQLFATTLFVAITLTCVVWLTQSLRFVEMIANGGLSASLFVYLAVLLLPSFLGVILPVALFVAVLFIYTRLLVDSKFVPLQKGVLSPDMKGVTVYVGSRTSGGELSDIIVHDARNRNQPVTMIAERASIVAGDSGSRVVLVTASRQQVDEKDGSLSLLYFDRYSFDLNTVDNAVQDRWREPRERYLDELFFSEDQRSKFGYFYKLRMEGHHRLSMLLLPLGFTLTGLAFLLGRDLNRRGQLFRILGAVSSVIIIEIAQPGFKNLGEKTPSIYLSMFVTPLLPTLLAAWLLGLWGQIRKAAPSSYIRPKLT